MQTCLKRNTTNAGFTLVEMLVAVSIFAIVMVISVGTLIVLLSAGSVAQSAQSIASNLSFAVDSMSRNIRTGYNYHCSDTVPEDGEDLEGGGDDEDPSDNTEDCADGGTVFIFTEGATGDRIAYWYDDESQALYQKVEDGTWLPITSTDVAISAFSFVLVNSLGGDDYQPTVRLLLRAEPTEKRAEVYPFYIQTTVTSKSLNI